MKKVIIAFILLSSAYSVSAQFSSIDTLRKFNNKYIRNSAVDAFTNLRLNTVINGIINFTDSAYNASAAGKLDSIVIVHDTVLVSYRGGSIVGRDTFRIVGTGIGTDSAQNAGFGLTKQVAGTTRTLKVDTAILFPAVRATIPAGSATVANSKWRTAVDGATININLDSMFWKIALTTSRAISFSNLHEGSRLELEVTHTTAGTTITNMPNLVWDFYWASGSGERTIFSGIYDSVGAKWNWVSSIVYNPVINPAYGTHMMLSFTENAIPKLKTWMTGLKNAGHNMFWAHMDIYDGTYATRLTKVLDSAYAVGVPVVPGGNGGDMTSLMIANFITDSWNHPNVYRYNGKKVFAVYSYDSTKVKIAIDTLTGRGKARGDYMVVVSTLYPLFSGGSWTYGVGNPADSAAVAQVYNHYPDIDGIINFSVDKGTSNDNTAKNIILNENLWIAQASKAQNKIGWVGMSALYNSVQFWDLGFSGFDSLWKSQISLAVDKRPAVIGDVTANDYKEFSYMTNNELPAVGGSSYLPDSSNFNVFNFGANISTYPVIDHSGLQKFAKPYIDAYRNSTSVNITAEHIFAWYPLHSRSVAAYTTVPSELSGYSTITAGGFWAGTPYANIPSWVGSGLHPNFDRIRIAAHLTSPAQLRINGTTSGTTYPAGMAFFDIPLTTGTPTFAIVRGGTDVLSGSGSKAITTNAWPGGWNYLIEQIQ